MRTTVVLPEHLLVEAKKLAADRKTSLTRVLEESLRGFLARERAAPRVRPPASLPVLRRPRPARGVDLTDTSRLLETE